MTQSEGQHDEELMSILAHDLRTPISSARSFVDMARYAGPLNEKQELFIERAMSALTRMEHLVNDVLDMSRVGQGGPLQVEPCDIRLLVGESVALVEGVAIANKITVEMTFPDDLPPIAGDPNLLRQVVSNLITNAIKYNRPEGTVWIRGEAVANGLQLTVKDTGYGISDADMEQIFDPFYRASLGKKLKIDGSGLGLAIVQAVVERHNGQINVESTVDEGTTFTVTLPQADSSQP
jgi:two-component system, OmpR family, phosphate regulon sensor histidine kinase PhoR